MCHPVAFHTNGIYSRAVLEYDAIDLASVEPPPSSWHSTSYTVVCDFSAAEAIAFAIPVARL
jgi:hypothetical protein